jgi:hypothetical protein
MKTKRQRLHKRPVMLEELPVTCESASYTRIREAEGDAKKGVRALVDGSILRSVEDTERGIAWGIRAEEYAACRMWTNVEG